MVCSGNEFLREAIQQRQPDVQASTWVDFLDYRYTRIVVNQ